MREFEENKMKKTYTPPELALLKFDLEDIVCTSGICIFDLGGEEDGSEFEGDPRLT